MTTQTLDDLRLRPATPQAPRRGAVSARDLPGQLEPAIASPLRAAYELAATVLATAPVAILVLAFQRRIIRGLTSGSVKG